MRGGRSGPRLKVKPSRGGCASGPRGRSVGLPMLARLAILSALALLLGLAACGGDDEGGGGTTTAEPATATEEPGAVDEELARRARKLIPIARQPQLGKSMKEGIRIADAQAELLNIAAEDTDAIRPLLAALEKPDYDLIIDMHSFYIQLGKPGSEKVIGEALLQLEPGPTNDPVVFEYLGSGNAKLVRAAERWAAKNGYEITGTPTPIAGGWGSGAVYGTQGSVPGAIPMAPPP